MIETISNKTGSIVTLSEAKEHLRVFDPDEDSRVDLMLGAAIEHCERWAEISLHLSATRTVASDSWPTVGWVLAHPPVTAVTSITYYDENNTQQTLSSSNYRSVITESGRCVVEINQNATRPNVYKRNDAVTVTYTTGWTTAEAARESLKAAILLTLTGLWGEDDVRQLNHTKTTAMDLLTTGGAVSYQ